MWEVLERTPLGRLSRRKFIVLLATLAVVSFGYLFASAPVVSAAGEATWKGDAIVYNNHTYEGPVKATENDPSGLEAGTTYYSYRETPGKGFIIYFASGVDPPSAEKATLASANFDGEKPTSTSNSREIPVTPNEAGPSEGTTSCAVEGIGWIICPVSNFIAKGMDLIYGYIQGFLEVRALATSEDQAMYRAWAIMRDLANVAFVIGFLILIYGQISGGLVSNYTLKKMLPRVIVAAVLVNISYWICAVAVDISNILGYAVQDLFISIRNSLVGREGNSWDLVSWESFTSLILSGGSAAAGVGIATYLGLSAASTATVGATATGAVAGLIMLLLPMLLGLLFIVLITFLILAARQAIITILIILAPFAFVAYLLPNTEKWFDKWRGALFTLLLLFPAFSVVFGGSQLAAAIIIQNASGPSAINMILLAMAVQVAPLAITPLLLKLGGGVLNRFANIVNDPAKGVFDRGKNWARERSAENRAAGLKSLAQGRTLARDAGKRGLYKTDRAGNLITDRNGNPISRRRNSIHNMAYAREYNRQSREGLKRGNESAAAGYFTQTVAGRGVYNLEQDAAGEKHAGEESNYSAYKTAMATGVDDMNRRRRDLHHQAHVDKGIGDLYEEKMTNHAERDLKTQVNSNPTLRNVKIAADVDAAQAKLQAASVEATGKLTFQNEVAGDRDLRVMKVATFIAEQQAASIDTRLQKNAEARWSDLSKNDTAVQQLRFQEIQATDKAKLAEEKFNRLVADAKLNGSAATGLVANDANKAVARSIQSVASETIQVEKATAAMSGTLQSSAEASFVQSTEGRRLTVQAQGAQTRLKKTQTDAETAYINSAEGRQLNIDNQTASDALEAAKAEEAAMIQEWRTVEGADGLTGNDAIAAQKLRESDIQKRAQTQRATAASGIADQEYAGQVKEDATLPGGTSTVAEVAGGIAGAAGISQAKARATQTIFKAFDESISAEKTLVSRNTPADVLKKDIPNPEDPNGPTSVGLGNANILDEPEERIAALAGKVAAGRHHESQIKLWERMGQLGRQANNELSAAQQSGDRAAIKRAQTRVNKVKSLEQQVFGDKAKVPFGAGDSDLGAASVGKYSGNIYASTRARLDTHMSAGQLASMDPDDIRLIFEMARADKLSDSQVENVRQAYEAWQVDDNLKATLQPKHRTLLDPISQGTFPDPTNYPNDSDEQRFWTNKYQSGLDSL